ncbi:MAG: hypothetical protein RMM08_07365 [Armatimonadota bacterium]|nr:hypothetical protein [bacterium]MDW8321164.1 hypothetical protein [Armatimonadota bacterium]
MTLFGAIRWDAWHGELSEVGKVVEKTLSPPQYRFRLPWFAQVNKDGTVRIRGDRPGVLEQEIAYALQAGLDYWAFVTYPEEHPLSLPLRRFVEMSPQHGLRFCNIVEWERFEEPSGYHRMVRRLVGYFRLSHYQRVLDGRPLLYLLTHERRRVLQQWGSVNAFHRVVDSLRTVCLRTGVGNPYIAVMHFAPPAAEEIRRAIGADSVSAYALPGGTRDGAPFKQALGEMHRLWQRMVEVAQAIPLVSWGWDPRPRVDNPVPWHQPGPEHYQTFTPEQCALAVKDALRFVKAHHSRCEANTFIAYAWNEHDEGGWLCPTLGADGKPDVRRVEAVGRVMREQGKSTLLPKW